MKKSCLLVVAALVLIANSALADSIAGKVGVTARGGFIVPADSEDLGGITISADTGWSVGGGLLYGINNNIAAELDVIYSQFDENEFGIKLGTGKTTDIALGLQYRFMPKSALVPYVGAGFDVIVNDFDEQTGLVNVDVDTTFGGHLSAGVDYFITKQVALNAEFKGVLSTTSDIKVAGFTTGAKFDPSNFSGLFGVRFFF